MFYRSCRLLPVFLLVCLCSCVVQAWPTAWITKIPAQEYADTWGVNPARAGVQFSRNDQVQVYLVQSSAPATILWPGEPLALTFQFTNLQNAPLTATGTAHIIQYAITTHPGTDVFDIGIKKIREVGTLPFGLNLPAKGVQDVVLTPAIPEEKGGYAILLDLPGQDRLFGATCVRTFKPTPKKRQFYRLCMDMGEPEALLRLGSTINRVGMGYKPTTSKDFDKWYTDQGANLQRYQDAGLPVTIEFGAGAFYGEEQPLGRPRPHLTEDGVLQDTKSDMAWLPSYDADFGKFVRRLLADYGWPKGPINAVKLWNEPWNGISISGWGADDLRYREIYLTLAQAVAAARKEDGAQVLVGGCDSSTNTLDKLFPDGKDTFLPYLDFLSIHYQGTDPWTTVKAWTGRRDAQGRPNPVQVWDTESWVANSDDRVAGVLAAMFSFGQARAVGIESDVVVTAIQPRTVTLPDGKTERRKVLQTWSVGAAVGAFQHFVGERPFKELLFKNGLPFVMIFSAEPDEHGQVNEDDNTVVVLGDMGAVFGADNVLFRTCRSQAELQERAALRTQLAKLAADAPERAALQAKLDGPLPYTNVNMTLKAASHYGLYDFYGNPVPATKGKIEVPLDARGFYLRGDGSKGSFTALLHALQTSRVTGLEPLAVQCADMTAPVETQPTVRLRLTNILNHPVTGKLQVTMPGLTLNYPAQLTLAAGETREVPVVVTAGKANASNLYPLALRFDAGADGAAVHEETMRVNCIAKRTITVDGKLDDWQGVLPQEMHFNGQQTATLTEKAWLPFEKFDESAKQGLAIGYLAYDEKNFYFAAKIADTTPDPGMPRFATRDDEGYFYPQTSYEMKTDGPPAEHFSVRWTGSVQAFADGDYTFFVEADDGARLWVDDKLLIDAWAGHVGRRTFAEAPLTLKSGQSVRIKLEYYQNTSRANCTLGWNSPVNGVTVVYGDRFTTPDGKRGVLGEYFTGTNFDTPAMTRVDSQIHFGNWPGKPGDPDFGLPRKTAYEWPEGVRRFSYRKQFVLPSGNAPNFDNVQLAFNVLAPEQKLDAPCPPGTMPGYIITTDTDYELALNPVAPQYGGGTEIWRLRRPDMPYKHFFPRQPASPVDGPAQGQLVITRDAGQRIVECAIPWSELPEVKRKLDAGAPIKFSYRVNDNAGVGCLELSRNRSVAKRSTSFRADWLEHWGNELEFGWEK